MKKRTRIVILAVCALMLYLTAANALAITLNSRASVEYGSNTKVAGVNQTLNKNYLYGEVASTYGTGTSDKRLIGRMCTRGEIWIHTRDEIGASPYQILDTLYWDNDGEETGTFFAEAFAPNRNHTGYCLVKQDGH